MERRTDYSVRLIFVSYCNIYRIINKNVQRIQSRFGSAISSAVSILNQN